jgi:hypothetical protein
MPRSGAVLEYEEVTVKISEWPKFGPSQTPDEISLKNAFVNLLQFELQPDEPSDDDIAQQPSYDSNL